MDDCFVHIVVCVADFFVVDVAGGLGGGAVDHHQEKRCEEKGQRRLHFNYLTKQII